MRCFIHQWTCPQCSHLHSRDCRFVEAQFDKVYLLLYIYILIMIIFILTTLYCFMPPAPLPPSSYGAPLETSPKTSEQTVTSSIVLSVSFVCVCCSFRMLWCSRSTTRSQHVHCLPRFKMLIAWAALSAAWATASHCRSCGPGEYTHARSSKCSVLGWVCHLKSCAMS